MTSSGYEGRQQLMLLLDNRTAIGYYVSMAIKTPTRTEALEMGLLTFKVKVPQLVAALKNQGVLLDDFGSPMSPERYLEHKCAISLNTAKKYIYGNVETQHADWNVLWKIYRGLRNQNVRIGSRPIAYSDVVEILEDEQG